MTSNPFALHKAILKNSPPGALGVITDSDGTRVMLSRTYYPSQGSALADLSVDNLVHRAAPFSRLYYSIARDPQTKLLDRRSVIVFCDGSVSNGTSGVGVFFGPDSAHNFAERLPRSEPQTVESAQLHAVHRALQVVHATLGDDTSVSTIVLATHSEYVVKALTQWVFKWRLNGWKDDQGKAVVGVEKVREVDGLIEDMASDGMDVEFWHVSREDNQDAIRMVNAVCRR